MSELHATPTSNILNFPAIDPDALNPSKASLNPGGLPAGFLLRPDGIWRETEGKTGDVEWVKICSVIRVVALFRRRDGTGWGRLVELKDGDGIVHSEQIDAATLRGPVTTLLKPLLDKGLVITGGPKVMKEVAGMLLDWRPEARFLLTDRLGWVDDSCSAFTLADGRVLGAAPMLYRKRVLITHRVVA